jgi:glycosyltransferase involved in cell wall biosynthesis
MLVSLIITTYNRPDALLLVLHSIGLQTKLPDEIIIADDGSQESTNRAINNFQKTSNLNIVHSWHEDYGFRAAESRNKAIANSIGDYVVLIDGDMILHPNFVQDHINNLQIGYFIQGSRALLTKRSTKEALKKMKVNFSFFSKGIKNRKNALHSNFLSTFFSNKNMLLRGIKTCNMGFFKQDCFDINGFNNDFIGWGREDSEFAMRLLNNGIKRKNLRFNALQFHLWHYEANRDCLNKNDLILKAAIDTKLTWCIHGIDKYI